MLVEEAECYSAFAQSVAQHAPDDLTKQLEQIQNAMNTLLGIRKKKAEADWQPPTMETIQQRFERMKAARN